METELKVKMFSFLNKAEDISNYYSELYEGIEPFVVVSFEREKVSSEDYRFELFYHAVSHLSENGLPSALLKVMTVEAFPNILFLTIEDDGTYIARIELPVRYKFVIPSSDVSYDI